MTGPKFEHDCRNPDCCRFLGHGEGVDVYSYNSMLEGTRGVIIRRSSDGPDYSAISPIDWLERIAARPDSGAEYKFALQLFREKESKS